jgi:Ca2+-binding EF-hand superfamily protein
VKAVVPAVVLLLLPTLALAQASGGERRAPRSPEKIAGAFNRMDTDKDGSISKAEWTAAGRRERGFARVDANHDGKITLDEFKTAAERLGGRRGGRRQSAEP